MAFLRKSGSILGKTVRNYISQEISASKASIFQSIRCMSTSKLFIGGLSFSTDDTSLREAFNKYGEVADARVIVDRETGRSRGFGFVTYCSVDDASAAIQALNQQELHGRRIRVDYANDRVRGYGGGGSSGGNFGGGFGGSYGTGGGYNTSNNGFGGNYGVGGYGVGSNSSPGEDNYASNTGYGGGNQNFGVAGGSGNFFTSGAGVGSNSASSGQSYGAGGAEGFGKDESIGRNYRDDDDTHDNNYADRRS